MRGMILGLWILIHVGGVVTVFVLRQPIESSVPWMVFVTVLFTPIYIWLVHTVDVQCKLGGVRSIMKWLEAHRHVDQVQTPEAVSDPRRRSNLAVQPVTITTGFAALLAFQTARFHRDLTSTDSSFLDTLLKIIAVSFVVACILNLVQILLHQFLAQRIWEEEQRGRFRKMLRFLQNVSWHFLLTPVILILCLLPYPWHWLCYLVNLLYGLFLYKYYFSLETPKGFPAGRAARP